MKRFIFLLFVGLVLFTGFGCDSASKDKMEGRWRRINVGDPTSGSYEIWEFEASNFAIYSFNASTGVTTQTCFGQYEPDRKLFKKLFEITESSISYYQTTYKIDKLNANTLIFYKYTKPSLFNNPYVGPLDYYEFTKE